MLTLNNVGMSFGDYDVFLGINAAIPNNAKIGLVGPNGIGKTTLLRILSGVTQPTAGNVTRAQGTRVGYLRQEAMEAFAERHNTLHGEMLAVFAELREQEAVLRGLEHRMAEAADHDALLADYSATQEAFERAGGYSYETRIDQVLTGLGFTKRDWTHPLGHLSGGQKTRALLARLLLEQPDLLILDEPTNHLDMQAVEWLEGTLKTWNGALLVVSHDRYFLDRVVDRIWEMDGGTIELYRGNYSAYLQQRQARWDRRETEFQTVKEKFLGELDYIKRNIARDATKDQAVGRLRRLIREVRVVQAGGLHLLNTKNWGQVMDEVSISEAKWGVMDVEQAIKSLQSPLRRPPQLNVHLKNTVRSGNLVLRSGELRIGYPNKALFVAEPIQLERGEVAALIGPNGTGKTTFLKTLLGQMPPLAGEIRPGASLRVGYFAQAHERLDPARTVLETLLDYRNIPLGQARSYLAQYLFRGEEVYKPVRLLSGGERGRLALALLAMEDANFLLLDEPTNHLDIPAQEVLQETLENFQGTILLVSHDRYLIDRLATQIWALHGGRLHVFSGAYADYVAEREAAQERARQEVLAQRSVGQQSHQAAKQSRSDERKRVQAVAKAEARVHELEQALAQVEADLQEASAAQDVARVQELGERHAATQQELEAALEAWSALAEAAEPA